MQMFSLNITSGKWHVNHRSTIHLKHEIQKLTYVNSHLFCLRSCVVNVVHYISIRSRILTCTTINEMLANTNGTTSVSAYDVSINFDTNTTTTDITKPTANFTTSTTNTTLAIDPDH